jgi:hypothetical protein
VSECACFVLSWCMRWCVNVSFMLQAPTEAEAQCAELIPSEAATNNLRGCYKYLKRLLLMP